MFFSREGYRDENFVQYGSVFEESKKKKISVDLSYGL